MNTEQTVDIDASVTVFVGMNEAGKTVLLKALHKSADAVKEDEFEPVEDYPRKDHSRLLLLKMMKASAPCAPSNRRTVHGITKANKKVKKYGAPVVHVA